MYSREELYEIKKVVKKNGGPLPISQAALYKACREGEIPVARIGSRVFIYGWWLDEFLAGPDVGNNNLAR